MITVHHLNNSRSQRLLWLLEELQVPYQIKYYQRNALTKLAPKELKKIHPLGKSPILQDGETIVVESGAIIEYLLEKYGNGRLKPKAGTVQAQRFTYWLHYAEGSAMTPIILALVFANVAKAPVPFFIKPITKSIAATVMQSYVTPELKLHFGYLEDQLKNNNWFIENEMTAADIQLSFPIQAAFALKVISEKTHPRLIDFLNTIQKLPTYQKALEKGGPFSLV